MAHDSRQRESPVGLPEADRAQGQARRDERRRLGQPEDVQNCNQALACTVTWYDEDGNPIESDIRFNKAEDWSIGAGEGGFDIQSVAAHEFGHVRQFDHVTSGDNTLVMWPYISRDDTSLRKLGRGDARGDNTNY